MKQEFNLKYMKKDAIIIMFIGFGKNRERLRRGHEYRTANGGDINFGRTWNYGNNRGFSHQCQRV